MAEKSTSPTLKSGSLRPGLALAVCLGALAACASPQQSERLAMARTQFGTVQGNPVIRQADPASLQQAQQNLQQAEIAQRDGDIPLADHFALLAQRQMETATVKANAQTAQMGQQAQQQLQTQQQMMQQQSQASAEDLRMLGAQRTDRGLVLSSINPLFPAGSASLTPAAQRDLQPLVAFLRSHPQEAVTVEGFTDTTGNEQANQQLSQRRAEAVTAFLTSQGVSFNQVIARGMGEEYPITSNATPAGRQANRRVAIVLNEAAVPQTAQLPPSSDGMIQPGMSGQGMSGQMGMTPQGSAATMTPDQPMAPTMQQQGMVPPPITLAPGSPTQ